MLIGSLLSVSVSVCAGQTIDNIAAAQRLKGCTIIDGVLEIQIRGGSRSHQSSSPHISLPLHLPLSVSFYICLYVSVCAYVSLFAYVSLCASLSLFLL